MRLKFKHVKISAQFFINKFCFLCPLSYYTLLLHIIYSYITHYYCIFYIPHIIIAYYILHIIIADEVISPSFYNEQVSQLGLEFSSAHDISPFTFHQQVFWRKCLDIKMGHIFKCPLLTTPSDIHRNIQTILLHIKY